MRAIFALVHAHRFPWLQRAVAKAITACPRFFVTVEFSPGHARVLSSVLVAQDAFAL